VHFACGPREGAEALEAVLENLAEVFAAVAPVLAAFA
jgi:hypothetical protein